MRPENRPFLIAITGGIASGKSTVSSWFEKKKFKVYYADKIGHDIMHHPELIRKLTDKFGDDILTNNSIDRVKLGNFVFSNSEKLGELNEILHPAIRKRMQEICDNATDRIIFLEIPLLFEGKLENSFDLVVNIHVNHDIQVARLISRNNFNREEAEARISSQLPTNIKIKMADVNIDNNGNLDQLCKQLQDLLINLNSYSKKEVSSLV